MSDERFDDAIRDALLADDPGAVPVRLRSRMAMIPDEAVGATGRGPWRERISRYGVPMGVLAAAAIIVVVFGSIALRAQQVATVIPSVPSVVPSVGPSVVASVAPSAAATSVPSPSASEAPSATAEVSPSPSAATSSPATPGPSAAIAIDPSKVTGLHDGTFAMSGTRAFWRGVSDTVSEPLLGWMDLLDTSKGGVLVDLKNGHDIGAYALTDAGIVWIETWYTDAPIDCANTTPCSPHGGQPVSWALNLTTLDGQTTKLDSGVVSRISAQGQGATPLPPEMAAQGNRVVYAVPRTVSGSPQASQIVVRSLPDGSVIRSLDTSGYVAQLGIFGPAFFYRRAIDTTGPSDVSNAYLNVVANDTAKPVTLDGPVAEASIGDGGAGGTVRIAWTPGYDASPAVRWANLGETKVHTIAVLNTALIVFGPVIIGDGFAWRATVPNGDGTSSFQVQAWRPSWPGARSVPELGSPEWMASSDGKLLFSAGSGDVPILKNVAPEGALAAADLFGK